MNLSGGRASGDKRFLRLFDANLNRCREGLRVIEDTGRFVLLDEKLRAKARKLRHGLDAVTRRIYPELLSERESAKDPGRKLKEGPRGDLAGILSANCRRAEEALRVLEEYAKFICPEKARDFKAARYELYSLEKTTVLRLRKAQGE